MLAIFLSTVGFCPSSSSAHFRTRRFSPTLFYCIDEPLRARTYLAARWHSQWKKAVRDSGDHSPKIVFLHTGRLADGVTASPSTAIYLRKVYPQGLVVVRPCRVGSLLRFVVVLEQTHLLSVTMSMHAEGPPVPLAPTFAETGLCPQGQQGCDTVPGSPLQHGVVGYRRPSRSVAM